MKTKEELLNQISIWQHKDNLYTTSIITRLLDLQAYAYKPSRPKQPSPSKIVQIDIESHKEYILELEKYEADLVKYNDEYKLVGEYNKLLLEVIDEFILDEAGVNSIPEDIREKIVKHFRDYSDDKIDFYDKLSNFIYDVF
jgi:hypothetical protein